MKNLKTMILAALLGTSAVAAADPGFRAQASWTATTRYDRRPDAPRAYQPYQRGMRLGNDLSFQGTDGRVFLNVRGDTRGRNTLLLTGNSGRVFIQMVKVTFQNGREQMISGVDRMLTPGEQVQLSVDGGARVKQITVWTQDKGKLVRRDKGSFDATMI